MPFLIPQRPSLEAATRNQNVSNPTALQAFGILSDDGVPVKEAFHYRGGRCLTEAAALHRRYLETTNFERLSGKWYFGGILFSHFGHFLTESIHRLRQYVANQESYNGVIFIKSPHAGTFSFNPLNIEYIYAILTEYFNIPKDRILISDSYLEIECLHCNPQEQQLGGSPDVDYMQFLGRLEKEYLKGRANNPKVEKIFLSRKNYLRAGRALGMKAVERIFSNNGYFIISPENHTIREQFLFVSDAKKVVCEAGSALHLFDVLGPQRAELVVMSRRGFDAHYWKNLYGNRVSRFFAFDKALPMHSYFGTTAGAGHSLYHTQFLIAFLQEIGLEFNPREFISDLRAAVNEDIRSLGVSFASN